jgi:hypothetical protein
MVPQWQQRAVPCTHHRECFLKAQSAASGPQFRGTWFYAILWYHFHFKPKFSKFPTAPPLLPPCSKNDMKKQQRFQSEDSKYIKLGMDRFVIWRIQMHFFQESGNHMFYQAKCFKQFQCVHYKKNHHLTCGGVMWTLSLPPTNNRTVDENLVFVFITCGGCFSIMNVLQHTNKYLTN